MSYGTNPFYNPESFTPSLELVASLSLNDDDYQFDYVALWRVKGTRRYYTATDSGCSCPTPFEDYTKLDDLTSVGLRARKGTKTNRWGTYECDLRTTFQALVDTANAAKRSAQDDFWGVPPEDSVAADFIRVVRRHEREYKRALRIAKKRGEAQD